MPSIRIKSRAARWHYGVYCYVPFDENIHNPHKKFIPKMIRSWVFANHKSVGRPISSSNDSIKEAVPRLVPWSWDQKVSLGRPGMLRIMVYNCSSRIAPVDMTNDASKFVEVTANLGTIPESRINRERGTDGSEYYQVDFDIEVTCYRERIEFTLVYAGKRYDAVTKEYM
ncbi:hypothetical protein AJ80_04650 [Polytolypa hystricis UAMH7299]|uniref:Uncharacterized protein n=1 Tax=Polytolypa hystricis (strain UAMH7299) TaxID=1447883 RepID=A0A2B7YB46_POLH7|nr:hypothetical protein AJ80_04650 [Polytolypa hystricis UAMH7299]